jgi:hypothetical protein
MNIAVIGLGRSGTKAIYSVLQEMLIARNASGSEFVYEPFLWDRTTFERRFSDIKNHFGKTGTKSQEGILNHLSLPLLIKNPQDWLSNSFIKGLLTPYESQHNLLLKFIRANGRIRLLHRICPELKFVFVIRNPLDTIHSVLQRFSYFGGEFHQDDYPRFQRELQEVYGVSTHEFVQSNAARQVQFWYYMNRFALETFRNEKIDFIRVCLESYSADPNPYFQQFYSLLGDAGGIIPESYAKERIGAFTTQYEISRQDYDAILPFLELYPALLNEFNFDNNIDLNSITEKYIMGN